MNPARLWSSVKWVARNALRLMRANAESLVQAGIVSLVVLLAFLSILTLIDTLSRLRSGVQTHDPFVDPTLINALSTLLLGLVAIRVGGKLRRAQEDEAAARARLALNVELKTRVITAEHLSVLEVIVGVHNISRRSWAVPMSHLKLVSALDGLQVVATGLAYSNLARLEANMCLLQPDERDEFFAKVVLDRKECPSALVVSVEVVGVSAEALGTPDEHMRFVEFMDENSGARHNYFPVGRQAERGRRWYGLRCFVRPNGELDEPATEAHRLLLDRMMLWTREGVVSLTEDHERSRRP